MFVTISHEDSPEENVEENVETYADLVTWLMSNLSGWCMDEDLTIRIDGEVIFGWD